MTGSVLFYVQHLLGIGHVQRSLRVAEALARDGQAVTLICGGPPLPALAVAPNVELVQLPPVRARDARFELVDACDNPIDDRLRERRRAILLAIFAKTRPDAVVIEGFPFARRAFRFELDPLIAAVRDSRPRPRLLCSVRDVIVMRDDPARHRDIVARVRADFDAVLVHGDPALIPFEASFPAAAEIADWLIYTGYVTHQPASDAAAGTPPGIPTGEIVVSAGGGIAGGALMAAALAARRRGCLADMSWRLLAGTNLPDADYARLREAAPAGVMVERFRSDFTDLLRHCRVSVSQLGYNTALDILAARAPAVVVPFAAEHETEQLVRAECLAARGAVQVVREDELSPKTLARAIERAAATAPATVAIDIGGAARSARVVACMIAGGDYRAEGLVARHGEV